MLHSPARFEHLMEMQRQRRSAVPPAYTFVAADDLIVGDRWRFGGMTLVVTSTRPTPPLLTVEGEYGATAITVEFLPFECIQVELPRPPR